MKSNLNVLDKKDTNHTEAALDDQKQQTERSIQDGNNLHPADNEVTPDGVPGDKSSQWVMPKSIKSYLWWKKWREKWVPLLNVGIAFLAFMVIVWQRQIMNRQSKLTEQSLRLSEQSFRVSERAYVGVASLTANLNAGEIVVILHNIGNIPAKGVRLEVNEFRVMPSANEERTPSGETVNEKQVGSIFHWEAGDVQLFPATPMPVVVTMRKFKPDEINPILERKQIVYIGGTIHYDDGFGNGDKTTFAFQYDPPPKDRWVVHAGLSKLMK